jgi:MFS family permease
MKTAKSDRWFYSAFFGSATTGPLGTIVALKVLSVGGTVIQYGVIASVATLATVIASIFWGILIDEVNERWLVLGISYFGVMASLIGMYSSTTLFNLAFSYVVASFFQAAAGPASNVLIMQLTTKDGWSKAFGRYNAFSSAGVVFGYVVSSIFSTFFSLNSVILILSPFCAISTALVFVTLRGVSTPPIERRALALNRTSFISRLLSNPTFFLHLPRKEDLKGFVRMLRTSFNRETPLLYLSLFVFNFSSGIFNTAFNPSLVKKGLENGVVLGVNLFVMVVQTLSMRIAGRPSKKEELSAVRRGLAFRMLGYVATSLSIYFLASYELAIAVGLSFALSGGYAYSLIYVSMFSLVFDSLQMERQGGMLGIVSALSGVGVFLGSLVSGYLAFYAGYTVTDLVAAVFLGVVYYLLRSFKE